MNDRTKADKAWEARQEAARYRIFNAATNAAEATDEADDEKYFVVLDQAGNAAEAAAAKITGFKTYADLLEALDTRRKQSQGDEYAASVDFIVRPLPAAVVGLDYSPSTRRRCSSRISSAILVRDRRKSSANGACGRHERHESAGNSLA